LSVTATMCASFAANGAPSMRCCAASPSPITPTMLFC
jgi:hypothetical protein